LWVPATTPSVDTGCFPYSSTIYDRKRSATNIFRSLDILDLRISLFSGSIATQNQMYSEPTFTIVSSRMYSSIFFFFVDIFFGLYFCIHFQIETGFILTNHFKAFAAFLNDKPRKYKYNPYPINCEGVLFLESIKEIRYIQAIGFFLS
jgi:hypothetical protein